MLFGLFKRETLLVCQICFDPTRLKCLQFFWAGRIVNRVWMVKGLRPKLLTPVVSERLGFSFVSELSAWVSGFGENDLKMTQFVQKGIV